MNPPIWITNSKCSMTIEELQTLIDKLSADIDLQKEVLKQLERTKSTAQRELNAIRDPVARFPLEISSEIFLQCLPPFPPAPASQSAPRLFMSICNAWADIALSTPALWTSIHLGSRGARILEVWLRRARNCDLSLSFHRNLDPSITTILREYAGQVKKLDLCDRNLDGFALEGLGPFARLQTLKVSAALNEDYEFEAFSFPKLVGLLRLAPNLMECILENVHVNVYTPEEKVILPHLRSFKFGDSDSINRHNMGDDDILHYLSLPALDTLTLPVDTISSEDLTLFLKRSSPPASKVASRRWNC
ncbi:hypothetical protein MVEN_02366500 [Mycena venus]|uniref:F-box domain-containing protein n=1 Tax=Mycena venus TaxID=2733690 RepID=A0A8H6X380_9AGAR|nr:hypothetical protein MVEN_02366500 [Mycena venus]